jgi:hypothetical protein
MADAARLAAQARFSTELIIPKYEDYYREVLQTKIGDPNF